MNRQLYRHFGKTRGILRFVTIQRAFRNAKSSVWKRRPVPVPINACSGGQILDKFVY